MLLKEEYGCYVARDSRSYLDIIAVVQVRVDSGVGLGFAEKWMTEVFWRWSWEDLLVD